MQLPSLLEELGGGGETEEKQLCLKSKACLFFEYKYK